MREIVSGGRCETYVMLDRNDGDTGRQHEAERHRQTDRQKETL